MCWHYYLRFGAVVSRGFAVWLFLCLSDCILFMICICHDLVFCFSPFFFVLFSLCLMHNTMLMFISVVMLVFVCVLFRLVLRGLHPLIPTAFDAWIQ